MRPLKGPLSGTATGVTAGHRQRVDVAEYARRVQEWSLNRDYLMAIAPLTQQRVERLSDLGPLTLLFFTGLLNPTAESLVVGKLDAEGVRRVLEALTLRFDLVMAWNRDAIDGVVREVAASLGLKLKAMLKPVYVAITGSPSGVPLFDAMAILGKDLCRARLRQALAALGEAEVPEEVETETEAG